MSSFGCVICHLEFCYNSEDTKYPIAIKCCGHVFHNDCLQEWFKQQGPHSTKSCPVCRAKISNFNTDTHRLHMQEVNTLNETEFYWPEFKESVEKGKEKEKRELISQCRAVGEATIEGVKSTINALYSKLDAIEKQLDEQKHSEQAHIEEMLPAEEISAVFLPHSRPQRIMTPFRATDAGPRPSIAANAVPTRPLITPDAVPTRTSIVTNALTRPLFPTRPTISATTTAALRPRSRMEPVAIDSTSTGRGIGTASSRTTGAANTRTVGSARVTGPVTGGVTRTTSARVTGPVAGGVARTTSSRVPGLLSSSRIRAVPTTAATSASSRKPIP